MTVSRQLLCDAQLHGRVRGVRAIRSIKRTCDAAEIGHPQSRRVAVAGSAVNIAAHIRDHAPRDHYTICVSGGLRDGLASASARFAALSGSLLQAFEIA